MPCLREPSLSNNGKVYRRIWYLMYCIYIGSTKFMLSVTANNKCFDVLRESNYNESFQNY